MASPRVGQIIRVHDSGATQPGYVETVVISVGYDGRSYYVDLAPGTSGPIVFLPYHVLDTAIPDPWPPAPSGLTTYELVP